MCLGGTGDGYIYLSRTCTALDYDDVYVSVDVAVGGEGGVGESVFGGGWESEGGGCDDEGGEEVGELHSWVCGCLLVGGGLVRVERDYVK